MPFSETSLLAVRNYSKLSSQHTRISLEAHWVGNILEHLLLDSTMARHFGQLCLLFPSLQVNLYQLLYATLRGTDLNVWNVRDWGRTSRDCLWYDITLCLYQMNRFFRRDCVLYRCCWLCLCNILSRYWNKLLVFHRKDLCESKHET